MASAFDVNFSPDFRSEFDRLFILESKSGVFECSAISRVAAFVCLLGTTGLCFAQPAEEITWEDLLPETVEQLERAALKLQGQLRELTLEQRQLYRDIRRELTIQDTVNSGKRKFDELSEREQIDFEGGLSEGHPEAVAFWRAYRRLREEMSAQDGVLRDNLDGREVRIPGYLLPLEFEGTSVKEFLLVPYVGACIHVPPPPPNQMIYVQLAKAYANEGLYQPVWVKGTINANRAKHELHLVDGAADIDVGYAITGTSVVPYE